MEIKIYSCEISEQEEDGEQNKTFSISEWLLSPLSLKVSWELEFIYGGNGLAKGYVQILRSRILSAGQFSLISFNGSSKARFYVRAENSSKAIP